MADSFWTDVAVDPKRSFRWIFRLSNLVDQWLVRSVKKPSFSVGNIAHQYINHTFYYPGRVNWNPVDVTIVDPAGSPNVKTGNDSARSVLLSVLQAGYKFPNTRTDSATSISKEKANTALGTPILEQIDSDGNPIEEWILKNAWVESVDFGNLDYGSEEMVTISMTLRYDWAELNVGAALTPVRL